MIRRAIAPSLSPDGTQLSFRSSISGKSQIWLVNADGGWPKQLTFRGSVTGHRWSPGGDAILYVSDTDGDERPSFTLISPDGQTEREILPNSDAFRQFGDFEANGQRFIYASTERTGLHYDGYMADVRRGTIEMVFEGRFGYFPLSWQPGGDLVIVSETRGEDGNDVHLFDFATGAFAPLFQPETSAYYGDFTWLPDGHGFFMATNQDREFAALGYYDVETAELHILDEQPNDITAPDDTLGGVRKLAISSDGKFLAWVTSVGGYSRLHVLNRTTGSTVPAPKLPAGVYDITFAADATVMAIGIQGPKVPGDIWTWDLSSGALHRATHSSMAGLDPESFVVPTAESFQARDGVELHGLLYLPSQDRVGVVTPPLLLRVHGGPTAQALPRFDPLVQYLNGRGIAVFDLNFRGSTGFGKTFARLDNQEKRQDAVRDVIDALAWLRRDGRVSSGAAAVLGASYGGYLVNAAIGQYPDEFDAAVSLRGISDWVNALTDTSPLLRASDRIEYGDIEDPTVAAYHRRISPRLQFDQIRIPLLVVHGENDPRVPIAESDELVTTARANGNRVEYLRFTDEGHGVRKRRNQIYLGRRVADFIERELIGNAPR